MRSQGMGSWSPGVGLWAEEEVRGCERTRLRLGGHPRALFPTKLGQTLHPTEGVSVFTTQQGSDRVWGSSVSCLLGYHGLMRLLHSGPGSPLLSSHAARRVKPTSLSRPQLLGAGPRWGCQS